jgi:RNA polymerase sigma-70 factor (ECF subfamily)
MRTRANFLLPPAVTSSVSVASDEELLAGYRRTTDPGLLDELVRRHLGLVRSVVFPMVLNHSIADDLTQETFLRAIDHLGQFDGRAKFSTWLVRVAMNTTRSYLARQGRSPVEFRDCLPEPCETAAVDHEPLAKELRGQIEAALAELSPRLRGAIVLVGIKGLNPSEAAQIEGCTTATIYWRLHQARQQLKRRLEQYLA